MICFPNCKINLGLYIQRKRLDGYHDIQSVMYPVPIHDVLELVPSDKSEVFQFTTSGLPIPGDSASNLCKKAYDLLRSDFSLPAVKVHLHKVIPMGGGLGGGSADGAFMLNLMNTMFELQLTVGELQHYASKLGSDCPFFINNTPQLAKGRGELLSDFPIHLAGFYLLLVNCGIHVGTKEAYAQVTPKVSDEAWLHALKESPSQWKGVVGNDFEAGVFRQFPKLNEIKQQLYNMGAAYASMSGSGSTMFGIFKVPPSIPKEWEGYFSQVVKLK